MNLAWQRLMALVREPEGLNAPEPKAKTTPPPSSDDDDDEDDAPSGAPDDKPNAWERYAKRLRTEAANKRAENKALKEKLAAAEARILSEAEAIRTAAKSERDAAIASVHGSYTDRFKKAELRSALAAAGVVDVEAGLQLIDASGITIDDAGAVKGVPEAVAKLKEGKAYLFGTAKPTTTSTTSPPEPNKPEVKSVKDMTPDEYRAHKRSLGL